MRFLETKHPGLATFGLLFGATAWGIIWYPFRLMEAAGISGVAATFFTFGFALLVGVAFLLSARSLRRPTLPVLWLALAAGWTNLAYVLAVIDGEVMRVMLLFYLSPLWTLPLARLMLGERVGPGGLAIVGLSLCGALVMLWQPASGWPLPENLAEWLALSSGVAFALANVLTRRAQQLSLASKAFAVWAGVVGMALLVMLLDPAVRPTGMILAPADWLLMAGVGVVLMLTTLLVQYGVTHMPVTRASVIFLFELVVAAMASWLLADETMSLREWVGGVMIVASALFAAHAGSDEAA